jgi:hypothetical protein
MIDMEREQLASFAEAARRVPSSRVGRQLHPNTIWRWAKRGLKANNGQRVHLETPILRVLKHLADSLQHLIAAVNLNVQRPGK